jgi:pyruvate dehydrogenase E1 component alpha subunit
MDIPREKLLLMYERMLKIRHFEEKVRERYATGEMPGFVHLYLGEEAVAAGACVALHDDDYITSTHRGHGHVIGKGADMGRAMAELYAKSGGFNKGKGGSMHMASPELGILGADGIVGGGIPIATGAGLSSKLLKNGRVTVCFFGDGGSNQGTFHESINIAAAFDLPVVYVCEDNLFGVGTRQFPNVRKVPSIADRAVAYGIPGVTVDGNDAIEVYTVVKQAVERARRGEGPTLVDCRTYRWRTHFEGEPDTYRDPEEVKEWMTREPIGVMKARLVAMKVATAEELDAKEHAVIAEVRDALQFAYDSPEPDDALAFADLYAD